MIITDALHVDSQILLGGAKPIAAVAFRLAQIRVGHGGRIGRGSRHRTRARCCRWPIVASGGGQCPLVRAAAARRGRRRRRFAFGQIVETGTFREHEVEIFRVLELIENVGDLRDALRLHLFVHLGLHYADAGVQRAVGILLAGLWGVRVELGSGTAQSALIALRSGGKI